MEPTVVSTQGNGVRSAKNMIWKIEAMLPALVSINPRLRLSLYLAEEVFIVLLIIAAVLVLATLFAISLVLFSNGARIGFLWLKAKVVRFAEMHHHFGHREAVVSPSPRRP
jgi:hypothetical protein